MTGTPRNCWLVIGPDWIWCDERGRQQLVKCLERPGDAGKAKRTVDRLFGCGRPA